MVSPALGNVYTNFDFSMGQTDGQDMYCGLVVQLCNNTVFVM